MVATSAERRKAAVPVPSCGLREATVHEAKTHLSRLLAEVEAGGTVIITRRGKPVARLGPVEPTRHRAKGSMKHLIKFDERFFEPLSKEELALWGEI
ncbi:type II toxin-antitoxin system Phd/YefM family antitoxin [Enterovirga aerilata]|uniref:Antitoxin n=1 Tax=Enterovirga aerilata TaxID=2730920 RepID=A0A849IHN7_9HYPH|nr:type II toxin-antitoxin system prevent-host-death family antitoxin [Enterovirga sp. DB1703]NNM73443.1 type II toxin-antitoxin system prevent-host-death family antitoxin [Enterovirga sp. DB1703]